jgi:DNA (cytosine-5)-methyltransferase 1
MTGGSPMRLGSLCTGYGGLDLGVELAFSPLEHVWHAEVDPDASTVLAAHWPDVPNLGDLTAVDWSQVAPVDVLTAGFPCQDVSTAGKRAGLKPGTRSGLWLHIAHAISVLRPRLVVLENVEGLLSAATDSYVEPCPWCLGDTPGDLVVRALGAVLADLASLGFDAEWETVPASAVGAAHRRKRVFIVAWPAADPPRVRHWHGGTSGRERVRSAAVAGGAGEGELTLLPTPRASMPDRPSQRELDEGNPKHRLETAVALLPTPTAACYGTNQSPSPGAAMRPSLDSLARMDRWGQYAAAIARWEQVTGRSVPDPTEPGRNGKLRLSPRFVEWLMGLPPGHVTDHVGSTAALRILGNGVVPQQAAHALELLVAGGAA